MRHLTTWYFTAHQRPWLTYCWTN